MWETWKLYQFTVIRILGFFAYYAVGVLFYENIEQWNRIDSVYFITQSVSTVGYGNPVPITDIGKLFSVFYNFTGVLLIFTVVGDLTRHLFVEAIKKGYKKKIIRSKLAIVVRNLVNAGMWITIIIGIPLLGGIVFYNLENDMTYIDAFYFAAYTSTSVGYGDFTLENTTSIYFNVAFILISVALTAIGFEKIANVKRHIDEHELETAMGKIELNKKLLDAISNSTRPNMDGIISRSDYVLHMLMLSGKIDINLDVKPWWIKFKEFDLDGDDYLTMSDVVLYEKIDKDFLKRQAKQTRSNRPNQQQKKQIFYRILCELRDIFLETIKMKKSDEEFESLFAALNPSPPTVEAIEPDTKAKSSPSQRLRLEELYGEGSETKTGFVELTPMNRSSPSESPHPSPNRSPRSPLLPLDSLKETDELVLYPLNHTVNKKASSQQSKADSKSPTDSPPSKVPSRAERKGYNRVGRASNPEIHSAALDASDGAPQSVHMSMPVIARAKYSPISKTPFQPNEGGINRSRKL